MKCLNCNTQNDYRARQAENGRCKQCHAQFVFEPRKGDPITDLGFQNAVTAVSEDGRLAWLERQLYYEVARRVRRRKFLHRLTRRKRVSLDDDAFAALYARWVEIKGQPPGRLAPWAFGEDAQNGQRAVDAGDYAFDRLVVCDSDDIVDVLLANGFHSDHKSAVLSVSGYPSSAYELLLPRLRKSPPASVLVVHDADVEGCRLAGTVKTDPRWFGGVEIVNVVDGGLRPADARRFRGVHVEGSPVDVLSEPVTLDEAKWLRKHRLELTAARPRALLAVLAGMLVLSEAEPAERDDSGDSWGASAWGFGGDEDVG